MTGLQQGAAAPAINSRLEGLRNLSPAERLDRVVQAASLSNDERQVFGRGGLPLTLANCMIENVIGTFELPIGIATNFTLKERSRHPRRVRSQNDCWRSAAEKSPWPIRSAVPLPSG